MSGCLALEQVMQGGLVLLGFWWLMLVVVREQLGLNFPHQILYQFNPYNAHPTLKILYR